MTRAKAKRRWRFPRLNLATMLALVAIVGGSIGWYAYSARVQRQTVRALRDAGATVVYDWEWDPGGNAFRGNGKELAGWRRLAAERFGPDAVATVAAVSLQEAWHGNTPGATDPHIELVGRLKSLRELRLGASSVTEEGAAPIAGLGRLRTLVIHDMGAKSDPGTILSRLGEDSRLERLVLIGTIIGDEDIAAIARLSRLEHLQFFGGPRKFSDADLAKLSALPRLKSLALPDARITPEGLGSIGGMKSLESLSFIQSSIDDVTPLLQLPALKLLDLGYCRVGDRGISALARMPALEHFSMSGASLTDAGLAHLRKAPALETLLVRGSPLTAAGLESLAAIKTLKFIQIYDSRITAAQGSEFAKAHPGVSLQSLELFSGSIPAPSID